MISHKNSVGDLSALSIQSNATWDLQSIFTDNESWDSEWSAVAAAIPKVASYQGRLLESPETLHQCFVEVNLLLERVDRLHTYAYLHYYGDTLNETARALLDRAEQLRADIDSASAFLEPELLAADPERLRSVCAEYPPLQAFTFYFSELERARPHTLSAAEETLIATLSPLIAQPEGFRTALNDTDLKFAPVTIGAEAVEVSHGTIDSLLGNGDRAVRRAVYESYTDGYLQFPASFAQAITGQAKASLAFARVRNFDSTHHEAIFGEALPSNTFSAVSKICQELRPLFQRYFRARAKILGLEKIAEYDLLAPLSKNPPQIPYERAVDLVLSSLAPLGEKYIEIASRGLTVDRWADVYPKPGKCSNAFSCGSYGTRPFLLLNYAPTMQEVGTLAHELGHSMHTFIANSKQPFHYASYSSIVAETASNLNQVLLRAHVLQNADRDTALAVLDEAFYFAHRYLFLMPTLFEVEHTLHSTYADGGAMSATELSAETVRAFTAAYGDAVDFEPDRLGTKWAHFCHFYMPYYLIQYSIGISAAMSIGKRILDGEPGIIEKYDAFLGAGGSKCTPDIFKIIDIDVSSPDATFRGAANVVEGNVELLEKYAT